MGGGASSFPDLLTEDQIKAITASDFKDNLYATLCDTNGTVPKSLFVNCFEKGPEREVLTQQHAFDHLLVIEFINLGISIVHGLCSKCIHGQRYISIALPS